MNAADSSADNRRIARNAVYLYGRMLLTVGVSLYTTRVVLDLLGVDNYALYQLVGGIVAILGFINGTMALATQRFMNYEMGAGDRARLQRTFSTAMIIHLCIAGIVVVGAETVGLWYVNHRLVIPPERMFAANVTYQLSLLAAVAGIVQIPYVAAVMANEKMGFYALAQILNVLLKLGVALALILVGTLDTLIIYAVLMLLAAVIVLMIYAGYCRRRFPECRFSLRPDHEIFSAMLRFSGWDLYGNLSYTARMQGTIVILNKFGGLALNAAGNLCLTVCGTITNFAGSVVSAFRPQIIGQYAKKDFPRMLTLINACARYSFLLLGLLVVPIGLEIDSLLALWLPEVPAYTADFCRLGLIAACGDLLIIVACIGIHATGRVRVFSFISGTLYLLELPVMYGLLRFTGMPSVVYVVHCCFVALILLTDTVILHRLVPQFSIGSFWMHGVLVPLLVVAATAALTWAVQLLSAPSFVRIVCTALVSTALLMSLTFTFAITPDMRRTVVGRVRSRLHI